MHHRPRPSRCLSNALQCAKQSIHRRQWRSHQFRDQEESEMDVRADDQDSFADLPSPHSRILFPLPDAKESLCRSLACQRLRYIPKEPTRYERNDLVDTKESYRLCNPEWTGGECYLGAF